MEEKMRTKGLILIMSAVIAAASMTACGKDNETTSVSKKETVATTESVVTEETTSAFSESSKDDSSSQSSQDETEIEETSAEQVNENSAEYQDIALQLMNTLNSVDMLGGGAFTFDSSDTFTENNREFAKVSDTRFFSTDDIKEFMEYSLTENLISEHYSSLVSGDEAKFVDVNGTLYGDTSARGCGFPWTDTPVVISDITDSSFTATAEYDDYGAASLMTLKIVNENGVWKIDSFAR
jgi:hypothetical protein